MTPKVLNKHHGNIPSDAIYIGRGSRWGNPFVIGKDGTRDEVIEKYCYWILNQPHLMSAIHEYAGTISCVVRRIAMARFY